MGFDGTFNWALKEKESEWVNEWEREKSCVTLGGRVNGVKITLKGKNMINTSWLVDL